jgi:hypothetical protein
MPLPPALQARLLKRGIIKDSRKTVLGVALLIDMLAVVLSQLPRVEAIPTISGAKTRRRYCLLLLFSVGATGPVLPV